MNAVEAVNLVESVKDTAEAELQKEIAAYKAVATPEALERELLKVPGAAGRPADRILPRPYTHPARARGRGRDR